MADYEVNFVLNEEPEISADFSLNIMSSDHDLLSHRDYPNQHPISAITGLTSALAGKQDTLTAGDNIQIVNGVISATDTTYTAGTGISIVGNVISNTQTSAEWGNITGTLSNQTDLQNALNGKQDIISDLSAIRSGATLGATSLQPNDNISELVNNAGYITSSALTPYALISSLAPVATSGSYNDLSNKPTIPTVNNATLTIQKNSVDIDTFTANASVDKIINITVPTTAADVSALPNSTKYGASIDLSLDTIDYKLTLTLKDQDGTTLNSKVVDFPIESVVVNGSYDSVNQKIVLTLQNGNTIDIPVSALIAGLQTEITSSNKLDADLVDDSTSTNKFVTSSDKTTWNGKQDAISDLSAIRTNATNGASAYTTIQGYGNIVTHNVSEFATSAQGTLADSALQPNDNISELVNNAGYITSSALTGYATETWVGEQGYITSSALSPYALISSLATVATSGSYNDLTNKPTIPAAQVNSDWDAISGVAQILNKPTLATVATSGSYNDLTNKPTIPTDTSDLTNGAGFITGITSSDVTTALGYTPYDASNPSGYQANVIETVKVNGTALTPSSKAVDVTVPTESTVSGWGFTKNAGTVTSVNNVSPVSGNVTLSIPYGESTSAADATQKEVTISSITSLNEGQVIIVKPKITSTVADSTLKLNNFTAYPMLYGTAAITTSTDSIVWSANYPSWFRFDGSNWVFLGHGVDNNTTYTAMTTANGIAGTETTARLMRADRLKAIIQGTTLTGLSTSTSSAVVATDSITVAIGKLQAQIGDVESAINTIRGV